MNRKEAIELINDLHCYLEGSIGIGAICGTLGHDAGGVLSHAVLHNDPYCHELNEDGSYKTCQLNADDRKNVTRVYDDLRGIIDDGSKSRFCERLKELKDFLMVTDILKI